MKTIKALSIAFVAAAVVALTGFAQAGSERSTAADLMAVKFHADWCGSCKVIGPHFTNLGNKFDGKKVLFLTLDMTNESTQRQSEYLASALGLGKVWKSHAPKTGYILLIEPKSRQIVGKLTKKDDFKAMSTAIDRVLARSR
ncbi:MAG: thioredoxin [Proteobacteria bacterium]|nr:thioredoxin [Pseudomonadota bacterium]